MLRELLKIRMLFNQLNLTVFKTRYFTASVENFCSGRQGAVLETPLVFASGGAVLEMPLVFASGGCPFSTPLGFRHPRNQREKLPVTRTCPTVADGLCWNSRNWPQVWSELPRNQVVPYWAWPRRTHGAQGGARDAGEQEAVSARPAAWPVSLSVDAMPLVLRLGVVRPSCTAQPHAGSSRPQPQLSPTFPLPAPSSQLCVPCSVLPTPCSQLCAPCSMLLALCSLLCAPSCALLLVPSFVQLQS